MGIIRQHPPVMLFMAAFSHDQEIVRQGKKMVIDRFGPILLESDFFRFDEFTNYYSREMGEHLYKQLWAFEQLISPGELAPIKVETNRMEEQAVSANLPHPPLSPGTPSRLLNLDPGYIDLGKLILASTKDHCHRIWLGEGIFAETTLIYTKKSWQSLPWTYPDYQSPAYQHFLSECRAELYRMLR